MVSQNERLSTLKRLLAMHVHVEFVMLCRRQCSPAKLESDDFVTRLGRVSGARLPHISFASAAACGASGGPELGGVILRSRKLDCFTCNLGLSVARRKRGLGEDIEGWNSRDGIGISAEDFERLPPYGEESANEGDSGVVDREDRERDPILPCGKPS